MMKRLFGAGLLGVALGAGFNASMALQQNIYGLALMWTFVSVYAFGGMVLVIRRAEQGPQGEKGDMGAMGAMGPPGRDCNCQCKKLCTTTGKQVLLG